MYLIFKLNWDTLKDQPWVENYCQGVPYRCDDLKEIMYYIRSVATGYIPTNNFAPFNQRKL